MPITIQQFKKYIVGKVETETNEDRKTAYLKALDYLRVHNPRTTHAITVYLYVEETNWNHAALSMRMANPQIMTADIYDQYAEVYQELTNLLTEGEAKW